MCTFLCGRFVETSQKIYIENKNEKKKYEPNNERLFCIRVHLRQSLPIQNYSYSKKRKSSQYILYCANDAETHPAQCSHEWDTFRSQFAESYAHASQNHLERYAQSFKWAKSNSPYFKKKKNFIQIIKTDDNNYDSWLIFLFKSWI